MRHGILVALALAFLFLQPSTPEASAEEAWLRKLRSSYAHGLVSSLEELASEATLERAAAVPNDWAQLCECIWIYAPYVARVHPELTLAAIEAASTKADALAEAEGSTSLHQIASAWTTMARCRVQQVLGHKDPQPEWGEAAERLLEHGGGLPALAVQSATSCCEAAASPKADIETLMAQGRKARDKALAAVTSKEDKAVINAGWHADLAKSLLRRKKKGPAKKCITAALGHLEPFLNARRPTKAVLNAHYELAMVNGQAKLKVKGAALRATSRRVPLGGLSIDLPEGDGWVMDKDRHGGVLNLDQKLVPGPTIRFFSLDAWSFEGTLTLPDGNRFSAADVKKIARSTSDSLDAHYTFTELETVSKPKKARFHKSLSDGLVVVGEGTLEDSQRWARVIVYFFRSKELKKTYRLAIYEYIRTPEDDPALDLFLKSIRVTKK